jgi:hypothetical protein
MMCVAAITLSDFTPRPVIRGPRMALLFLSLGLLSFAAVAAMKFDCASEYLVSDDGLTRLMTDDGRLLVTGRYWLFIGNA